MLFKVTMSINFKRVLNHYWCIFSQQNFVCRSVEYNYVTLQVTNHYDKHYIFLRVCSSIKTFPFWTQCRLSDFDRRTPLDDFKPIELVDAPVRNDLLWISFFSAVCETLWNDHFHITSTSQGIDYFENLCLQTESTCADQRTFSPPRVRRMIMMMMMISGQGGYTPLALLVWLLLPKRVIVNCHPHNNFLRHSRSRLPPRSASLTPRSPSMSTSTSTQTR